MEPIILITADRRESNGFIKSPRIRPRRPEVYVTEAYVLAVRAAGGIPLIAPATTASPRRLLAAADGLLLTGGHFDIHPSHYGHEVQGRIDRIEEGRTHMELELARIVLDENIPVLGICGGMQAMAVADGGTLCQNIPTSTVAHEQSNDPAQTSHAVTLNQSASRWLPSILQVNSTHHQAVATCGKRLKACGWAPDGCIEVIASDNHPFALGLQWHPELIDQLDAYRALISSARKSKL